MSKFPDFYGFWEFPTDQNSVPKNSLKSQELGKFPTSTNTGSAAPPPGASVCGQAVGPWAGMAGLTWGERAEGQKWLSNFSFHAGGETPG